MTTFGFELAVDSNLPTAFSGSHKSLGSIKAGYIASTYGLLNIVTRPLGGYIADKLYSRYGVKSKKYFTLALGMGQGIMAIGFGELLKSSNSPSMASLIVVLVSRSRESKTRLYVVVDPCILFVSSLGGHGYL